MPRAGASAPRKPRKNGSTMEMVRSLPDTGSLVIVHDHSTRDYIENMIAGLRGNDVLRRTRVLVVGAKGIAELLRPGDLPVHTDHAYFENVPADIAAAVRVFLESAKRTSEGGK